MRMGGHGIDEMEGLTYVQLGGMDVGAVTAAMVAGVWTLCAEVGWGFDRIELGATGPI